MIPFIGLSVIGVGILFLLLPPVLFEDDPQYSFVAILFLVMGGIMYLLAQAFMSSSTSVDADISRSEEEVDLLEQRRQTIEEQAYRLFRIHQYELQKYYNQTLSQARWIFIVGIACIALGFVVVGGAMVIISSGNLGTTSQEIVVVAVAAVGAILSNFVAAVFLKMYSTTVRSLNQFHNRLVTTHHLHFANFLAAKIDDKDLRLSTLSNMAEMLQRSTYDRAQDGPES